jgi:hypothetical protein
MRDGQHFNFDLTTGTNKGHSRLRYDEVSDHVFAEIPYGDFRSSSCGQRCLAVSSVSTLHGRCLICEHRSEPKTSSHGTNNSNGERRRWCTSACSPLRGRICLLLRRDVRDGGQDSVRADFISIYRLVASGTGA